MSACQHRRSKIFSAQGSNSALPAVPTWQQQGREWEWGAALVGGSAAWTVPTRAETTSLGRFGVQEPSLGVIFVREAMARAGMAAPGHPTYGSGLART